MRVISINVNGINAFGNRGEGANLFFRNFNPEIICIQEVKGDKNRLMKSIGNYLTDYEVFVSESKGKLGYAGVAMCLHKNFLENNSPYKMTAVELADYLPDDASDFRFYCTGRILHLETDKFNLVNVYTLNSGNKDELRKTWDELFLQFISTLPKDKPLIIAGDFNVCHTELDMYKWNSSLDTYPSLMRYEIDAFTNLLSEAKLKDTFRELNGDLKKYSWFAWNGKGTFPNYGWRLDYFLCNDLALNLVTECGIMYCKVSDHYPIDLQINI